MQEADRIEASLNIPVIKHGRKKPEGAEEIARHFGLPASGAAESLQQVCIIGDRLLTDVVMGNLHGMLTIHTQPLTVQNDNRMARVARWAEAKAAVRVAGPAPAHPLSECVSQGAAKQKR